MNERQLPISRKAAILKAISILSREKGRESEVEKLKQIALNKPVVQWEDWVIRDCIDNFIIENGRLPVATDFSNVENKLPPHSNFKYKYGKTLRVWMNENYPSYFMPQTSRKQVLQLAYSILDGEEKEKVGELLEEYPIAKWNTKNLIDCFIAYYEDYKRVPSEDEMEESDYLPYYGLFQFKFSMSYLAWLEKYIPILFQIYNEQKTVEPRDYISEFISEYKRILPKDKIDFNRRRDWNKCCNVNLIMQAVNITRWNELLSFCGLKKYDKDKEYYESARAQIKGVNVIIVDE